MPRAKESRKHQKVTSVQWRRGGRDRVPNMRAPHISPRNRADRARQNSPVQVGDQQPQEIVDPENPQNRLNQDREARLSSIETKKRNVSIN